MTAFFPKLEERAKKIGSLLCVGLDPEPDALGAENCNKAGLLAFCKRIVSATSDFTLLYKPNSAFFERFGPEGIAALQEVIAFIHAQPGRPLVLFDGKRGDIDKTANAYANASFVAMGADCATVNPYMGFDTMEPYLTHPGKGLFALCKTSNPGSNDLQTLRLSDNTMLYERVAELCLGADSAHVDHIGLVVGATDVDAIRTVRAKFPKAWILCPGVGAQGGDLVSALSVGINKETKSGIVIAVSRQISKAADPRAEAEKIAMATRKFLSTL